MTSVLIVLVALALAVGLANLMFLYGVIRRLRVLDGRVNRLDPPAGPAVGHRVGLFTATTLDGRAVDTGDLAETETLVALLSAGCGACESMVAELGDVDGGSLLVLIHAGEGDQSEPLVTAARRSAGSGARIAVVPYGAVASAFDITAYPTVVRVVDGVVTAAGMSLASVREPAHA
jgi:hypothetical protein